MKQVIVIRTDLGMSKGKMIAQACHASVGAYTNTDASTCNQWASSGAKKVALKVESKDELMKTYKHAKSKGLSAYVVKDAGETELKPGTITAVGIGPADDGAIDKITKDLSLV